MKEMINPRLFKPASRKVKFMHRPKWYQSDLELQGVMYPLRGDYLINPDGKFKTAGAAFRRAERVYARWCRLYDAAVVAMSAQEPTPGSMCHER